jgi:tetratricopeptide (TPR) repeat protein
MSACPRRFPSTVPQPAAFRRAVACVSLLLCVLLALSANSRAAAGQEGGADKSAAGELTAVSPASAGDALLTTNLLQQDGKLRSALPKNYRLQIDTARQLRRNQDYAAATRMLVALLDEAPPQEFKRSALFELALVAQDERHLARAQQILAQYVHLFPQDPTLPEVFLRQGLIFRQIGANQLALVKFYAVLNSALNLKLDQFDYYKRLVLQAQTEIADTYHLQGKLVEAADFFGRILKQESAELNRPLIRFKLIRCLAGLNRHAEVVAQCAKYFEQYPDATEVAELRFLCATSLRQLGRSGEALTQVLKLLQAQEATAQANPDNWIYWQQRAGNQIANQLYVDGDYLRALEIYQHLAALDHSVAWQMPVLYQIGLIYERLRQPQKAAESFALIIARERELLSLGDDPTLKTVLGMAKWRKEQLTWQDRAELAVQSLHLSQPPPSDRKTTTPGKP